MRTLVGLYMNVYMPPWACTMHFTVLTQHYFLRIKVIHAYEAQVNLSAQGFYRTPDLTFDRSTGKGNMYNYFTYGASASEVEVDTLTGDFTILRSDLVMDVGDSLNPAIDIGQVVHNVPHACMQRM